MVNEEQKTEETKTMATTQNTGNGNIARPIDKVERAEQAVKRMEEIEKRLDEKTARLQELEANRILAGTSGGHIETMQTPEQRREAEAQRRADEIVKAFK